MKLKITDVNFTENKGWIFKLTNHDRETFYIMGSSFYSSCNLKPPISKRELDFYDEGLSIDAEVQFLGNKNIVTKIY